MTSLALAGAALLGFLGAQDPPLTSAADAARIQGRELYDRACARCHGADGRGDRPDIQLDAPMPNFARCAESAEETDWQWRLTIEDGGVVFGLSSQMPAYGEVLTRDQVDSLLVYIRTFCADARWVRGELNFQRALFTEKAYPENELVVAPRITREHGADFAFSLSHIVERRIGPRTQLEFALPFRSIEPASGAAGRRAGAGDFEVGIKHVLYGSLARRLILSAGIDVSFPTGRRSAGLGSGTAKFEPFVAFGKELREWVVQGNLKIELPADTTRAARELGYRFVVGYPVVRVAKVRDLFAALELVGVRDLERGEPNEILLVPQLRFPIDRMGRWAIAAGPTLPVTSRAESRVGFAAYLLYEYLGR